MNWAIFIGNDEVLCFGLVSWCVASGPKTAGLRKLRPRVELQSPWDKLRSLATEQKRNVLSDMAMTHL
jgi:hypothetical protein